MSTKRRDVGFVVIFATNFALCPHLYAAKNIAKFFIKVLDNVNSKDELTRIAKKFEDITRDEKITVTEWT